MDAEQAAAATAVNAELQQALAQTQALLQQREREVQEQAAHTANLVHQLDAANRALAQAPAGARQGGAVVKPQKPESYFGSSGDLGRDWDTWIFSVEAYFAAIGDVDDARKVHFTASLFKKNALAWWRSVQQGRQALPTWEQFKHEARTEFLLPNTVKRARDRLANTYQTKSVQDYNYRFRSLALQINDMSPAEKLDRYIRGLKAHIQRELELRPPATWEDAQAMAERIDRIDFYYRRGRDNRDNRDRTARPDRNSAAYANRGAHDGAIPMELGLIDRPSRPSKLTDADKEKLRQRGACFYCKETGHIAINCPKRPATSRPGNTQTR